MTIPVYKTILFLHVISAMALFTSLAFEWTSLSLLTARNQTLDLGFWLRIAVRAALAGIVSAIAAAASGAFMMVMAWRREAWLAVAMGPLVPFAALSVAVTLRKVSAILRQWRAAPNSVSPDVRQALRDARLQFSLRLRSGITLGITYVMVAKPDFHAAMLGMGTFVFLAAATALPSLIRRRPAVSAAWPGPT